MMPWYWAVLAVSAAIGFGQTIGFTGYEAHKQLEWKGAGGCVVNFVKTPCRTVKHHEYSFEGSLGFDGITRVESVEAVDQMGSEAKITTAAKRKFWFLPEWSVKTAEFLLRDQNRIVHIDYDRKVFTAENGGTYRRYHSWQEDDSLCSHAKSHYLYLSARLRDSVVAGIQVVGYGGRDDRGAEYEVYFAPSIGCQQLRFLMVTRNFLGWTTAKHEMVVDSYELGPPSSDLFKIPGGYNQVSRAEFTRPFSSAP